MRKIKIASDTSPLFCNPPPFLAKHTLLLISMLHDRFIYVKCPSATLKVGLYCNAKVLGNWKSDNNNDKKNKNVRSTWGPFLDPKISAESVSCSLLLVEQWTQHGCRSALQLLSFTLISGWCSRKRPILCHDLAYNENAGPVYYVSLLLRRSVTSTDGERSCVQSGRSKVSRLQ